MAEPRGEAEDRVRRFTHQADLSAVAAVLARMRDTILERWLAVTSSQPFHRHRTRPAIADHMPHLFDALVVLLHRAAPREIQVDATVGDDALLSAAREHARQRFQQGLQPADIVTEFRLLRHEIGRALRARLDGDAAIADVVGAELVIHDALDGAITLALEALTRHVEEVRTEFLATTAHDVLQPVTGVKGQLQLVERALSRPEPDIGRAIELLHRAGGQIDRLTRLVRALAEASQLALGRLEPHPAWTDLVHLVQAAIERLDPDTAERIVVDVRPGSEAIGWWDAGLLDRVIENLLSNALKYSPPDSPVQIMIRATSDDASLAVRDQGVGLSVEELAMLFRRYGRTATAAGGSVPGQGLGLYLCRGIVEAHGGRIWAESEGPRQGSAFFVCLPRSVPGTGAEEDPVAST